ncbi:hypothetical protein BDZ85DRAFT_115243 [Elsinoe ampelina]|uniref:SLS1 N-terminal domain-containing protein n=1 Tax=Elsinoe ampelina TaxID=302913 RepID=A0A6A6GDS7_9PEZI|nr:hypothetical protein BDZ85DRAFT_115243 [Elsinoe ampelina]
MSAPAARSAFTCARCRFHQRLRRDLLALSTKTNRRFASTEIELPRPRNAAKADAHGYYWRNLGPDQNLIGKKGRRQRADAERLKIKSLDQESDIIVLRDVAEDPSEPRHDSRETVEEDDDAESKAAETTVDIERLLVKGANPRESEIFAAIEQHRPEERELIKPVWNAKQKALAGAHTAPQLKKYLKKHKQQLSILDKSRTTSRKHTKDEVNNPSFITVTPWFKSTTSVHEPLPTQLEEPPEKLPFKKWDLVDQVFRNAWNLQIIEEQDTLGELEILLTRPQWKMLHTRAARDLFGILRKGVFFRRVRLEHDSKRGALRVRGPRQEAEALAQHFQSAFSSSLVHRVNLEPLKDVLPTSIEDTIAKFTPRAKQEIELLTGASVTHSMQRSMIWVAAFKGAALDEALRMVTMMLGLQTPCNLTIDKPNDGHGKLVCQPSDVPLHLRHLSLRREVTKARRYDEASEKFDKSSGNGQSISGEQLVAQVSDFKHQDARVHKLLEQSDHALQQQLQRIDPVSRAKMWMIPQQPSLWRVRFGTQLEESQTKKEPEKAQQYFSSTIPRLPTVSTWFDKLSPDQIAPLTNVKDRLIVKLIPSPHSENFASRRSSYPDLEICFDVRKSSDVEVGLGLPSNEQGMEKYSYAIPGNKRLVLSSIDAVLRQDLVVPCLPKSPVDLEFSRSVRATVDKDQFMALEHSRGYVEAIANSMKGKANLRAPKFLSLSVPSLWPLDTPSSAEKPRKGKGKPDKSSGRPNPKTETVKLTVDEQEALYYFAGFEMRETRQVGPSRELPEPIVNDSDIWTMEDVEAGTTGGKRLDFSLRQGSRSDNLLGFVRRALSMANFLSLANQGPVRPLYNAKSAQSSDEDKTPKRQEDRWIRNPLKSPHRTGSTQWNEIVMQKAEKTLLQPATAGRGGKHRSGDGSLPSARHEQSVTE